MKNLIVLVVLFGGCAPPNTGWPTHLWRQEGDNRVLVGTFHPPTTDTLCGLRLKDGSIAGRFPANPYSHEECYSVIFEQFVRNSPYGYYGWGDINIPGSKGEPFMSVYMKQQRDLPPVDLTKWQ